MNTGEANNDVVEEPQPFRDVEKCPKCGSTNHEVRNHSLMWHDGDIYCLDCGAYIRMFDAG